VTVVARGARVLCGVALCLAVVAVSASATGLRDGVGLAAGKARGIGFDYIHHTPYGWATTVTGILLKSNGDVRYDVAGGLERTLAGEARHRLYAAGETALVNLTDDHPHDFNIGVALGLESLWTQHIALSVEAAEVWKTRTGHIVITPAGAVHYYF